MHPVFSSERAAAPGALQPQTRISFYLAEQNISLRP
jgi:hypothetical protein